MKDVFINENSQLRSGWKILITFMAFFVLTTVISIVITIGYVLVTVITQGVENIQEIQSSVSQGGTLMFILMIVQTICMILAVVIFWRVLDKRPIRDIGFTNPLSHFKHLILGLIFGIASISIVFFILLASGEVIVVNEGFRPHITWSLVTDLILFIFVGISEELFSRGYCMTVLKQTRRTWVMVLVSSLIFSVMHALNPNFSFIALLNIFLVGIVFAFMFLKTGNLWMPIGYHITWNYFQGSVFGFQVSGLDTKGLYQLKLTSENIINGGSFGPEGGLIVTSILILSIVCMWMLIKKNDVNEPYHHEGVSM